MYTEPKSLTPINLIRMGLAYPRSKGVIGRPLYESNFNILDDDELKDWHKQILSMFKQPGKGPFALVSKIFGGVVAARLARSGHFPDQPTVPQRSVSNSSSAATASSTSRTSSKRTVGDIMEDDDDWLMGDEEERQSSNPSRRRRIS